MNGQNVGVIESACCPCLLLEAPQTLGIRGDCGRQNLDRHVSSDAGIRSTIDLTHATCPEEADNPVRSEYPPDHRLRSAFGQGLGGNFEGGGFQEVLGLRFTSQKRMHFAANVFIGAGLLKITATCARVEFANGVIQFLDLLPAVQS